MPEDNQPPELDPGFGGGVIPAPKQFQDPPLTGGLEDQPHNVLHDLIGGLAAGACGEGWMSDPLCAALDPIFWLHHSNIDRVWVLWLTLGGGRVNPQHGEWLGQEFGFFDERGAPATLRVRDVLDTTALQYRYDNPPVVAQPLHLVATAAPPAAAEPVAMSAGGNRDLAAAEGVRLTGERSSVSLPLAPDAQPTVESLRSAPDEAAPVYLVLDDIAVHAHPGFVYAIYLNARDDEPPGAPSEHRVGFLSFFGLAHGHDEHEHAPARRSFRITSLVHELQARGKWDPSTVTVSFVPVGLEPPGQAEGAGLVPEGHQAEGAGLVPEGHQPEVVVGSVRIVTG